ncbi:beta-ketoacyl synthase N-terminal-like domain-containing protein [Kitasatospora sp. NPDC051853]|uniref:beta-ketoacyl synthase N-terminal-like domain-containing protein n=1 Tax=Kitasatospora sp. NPDC051853 TaxID=3364058 RepID=UPI0037A8C66E
MTSDASTVAIVGMAGRFPGARDLTEYWANLRDGVCSITDFDRDRLRAAGVPEEELSHPDYVPAKGFLADADRFDAELFGFNRAEAAVLDPQHRLLLETAWNALEDAGHDPLHPPARTGVYVGGSLTEHHLAVQTDRALAAGFGGLQLRILTDREFLAPWISYRLGLDGPSLTVQTACSTSLTAVHLAVQALLLGECDAALAGGVSVDTVEPRGYRYRAGDVLSPDGRCRPFDERSAGTVTGNGVGLVLLKRLEDALADGDPVHAVIRGSAVTNDGSAKVGFTAPSVDRQSAAVVEAWAAAGLEPSDAGYLEMHGTATELGDRIELAAATAAFGKAGEGAGCGIGSVKSNLGHLDAASGVAGLIKVALMLRHRTLAPTVNVSRPHPDLLGTPFSLVTAPAAWEAPAEGPRLAGLNGTGIGGTNVHLVLAEAPEAPPQPPPTGAVVLPVSARTADQLAELAGRLAGAVDGLPLAGVARTLRTGRAALDVRAHVVATDGREAAEAFAALAEGRTPAATDPSGEEWARGGPVDWPALPPGTRRVHLPALPFAGEPRGARSLSAPAGDLPVAQAAPAVAAAAAAADQERVAALLVATLGLDGPEELATQTYFGAGGDSLTAVQLLARLRDELGLEVPLELFLEQLTLRELASRIVAGPGNDDEDALLASLLDEFEAEG